MAPPVGFTIANLVFFDKNGESYNFTQNELGHWEGADYFLPISTALFDCSNIFILENTASTGQPPVYKFPRMAEGSSFEIVWTTQNSKTNFFLFTVQLEDPHSESSRYMVNHDSLTINYSDFNQISGYLNLTYPMQINVAFTPTQEIAYSRVLQIYYTTSTTRTKVLEMVFYGEGEDEDERFRIWLANFGVKFNREDALLLKDYDLKEGLPDWQQINIARKQLLVTIDQVYPYVGTYKGMVNLINILGYRDVLRVKEYWKDSDTQSLYYGKFAMVDVTDLMNIGDSTQVNLVDENGQIKKGGKFIKTEFLALAYEFTVASDHYDDDGLPIVVSTTEFTVNEIFFKLDGVARKLKEEILPINVLIKDIIGEFIYFTKFNLRDWPDTTFVENSDLSDTYTIKVLMPTVSSTDLKIRDIKALYPKLDGISDFPDITFNIGQVDPYQDGQHYPTAQLPYLMDAITAYYDNLVHNDFYHIGESVSTDNPDDIVDKIGCPIILEAYIPDLTLQQLDGIKFGDFILSEATTSSSAMIIGTGTKYFDCYTVETFNIGSRIKATVSIDQSSYMVGTVTAINKVTNTIEVAVDNAVGTSYSSGWVINLIDTHFTIGNLKYKNGYEIEWVITGPHNYYFQWRDRVSVTAKIPHILPYTGDYLVLVKVHDMQSGTSVDYQTITVKSEVPVLEGFVKIQDKTRYDFKSLHNVTIGDLADSPLYKPYAAIVNLNGDNAQLSDIYTHYLDWYTYSHHFGVGNPQEDVQIYDAALGYQPQQLSNNPIKSRWGTGSGNGQPTIKDYAPARLKDMKFVTFSEMGYAGDLIDGFYLDLLNLDPTSPSSYLTGLQFGGFTEITFSTLIETAEDLLSYLESTTLPGWKEYRYQIFGNRIKATAKYQEQKNHSIIKHASIVSGLFNSTEYLPGSIDLDISSTIIKLGLCTLLQSQMVGPSGPFVYTPSGPSGWVGPSGPYYENSSLPYWINPSGFVSSGPSLWLDGSEKLWPDQYEVGDPTWPSTYSFPFPTVWSNTMVTFGSRIRIVNLDGGYAEGYVIAISDYEIVIDVDLINEIGDFSEFSLSIIDILYTFTKPMYVYDRQTMVKIQNTLSNADLQLDEDLLFLVCPFNDQTISTRTHKGAAASDIRYWINKGCVIYDNINGIQTGYLPSSYDQNSLNMNSVRASYNTMIVPLYHPVFIIISNLTSNVETEWTLSLDSVVIAKIKTTSYFVWRFDTIGKYELNVKSTDTRGNVSILDTTINAISIMTVDDYQQYIEKQLNDRKYQMTHQ
jgi:hypothetical protein